MNRKRFLFTSESVTEGHPDKVADQISDAILDAIVEQDPYGRVALETLVSTGMAVVVGEISTTCYVEMPKIIRETIKDIGYDRPELGFDWQTCAVLTSIKDQSPDIAQGVVRQEEDQQGAGDQGMMFGYATTETPELMPLPIMLAHRLTRRLAEVRKKGILKWLRPDGKSQVTVEYVDGKPCKVAAVVIAAHHDDIPPKKVRDGVIAEVINKVIPKEMMAKDVKIFVNPTGRFVIGGPMGDTGVTGRKIIVDTYGGVGSHGGGCFSGKDCSKVDRSASYAARWIAKNIVAAGIAKECEVQLAYAIGVPEPVSIMVNDYGTSKLPCEELTRIVRETFDLRPAAIIRALNLRRPIYKKTATYGHFGREDDLDTFTWERRDKVEALRKAIR